VTKQNARGALAVADYGYVVEHGEIALEGAAGELAENPRVAESYLA
jgi:branched-chain amino acid transport system ATP-binding protein